MSYIWQNYSEKNTFKVAYQGFSPYLEIYNSHFDDEIKVNVLIRFSGIFKDINFIKDHKDLDNVLLHFLAQLDLQKGLYKSTLEMIIIKEDIQNNMYGLKVKELFNKIDNKNQEIILKYMLKDIKNKQRKLLFQDITKEIFPKSSFMYSKSNDEFILYVGEKETLESKIIVELIKELFLDIFFNVYVTWEYNIGIIDVDETMKIDNFIMY